jgi:hypothetical protein
MKPDISDPCKNLEARDAVAADRGDGSSTSFFVVIRRKN